MSRFGCSRLSLVVSCCALSLGLATGAAADKQASVDAGFRAYRAGDFAAAAQSLLPHRNANPEVQYLLGTMYLQGLGVPQDDCAAENLLTAAARAGNSEAQLQLGLIYLDISVSTASEWLDLAANSGNRQAMFLQQRIISGEFADGC